MYHRFIFLHKIEKIIFCKYVELPCFPSLPADILWGSFVTPKDVCGEASVSHVLRESKLDSLGFCIPWRRFQVPFAGFQFLLVELGFWISIISGILDSLSHIPDSKVQDSVSNKHKFPGFCNLDSLTDCT